jgi:hypothetical protein
MAGARQGETPTTPVPPVGNSQPGISETQLQGREVTPASWAAAKRGLTWTTTTLLKSYLKLLSVVKVSNAVNKIKVDAIAARMRQYRIPLRSLEDAEIARDMRAAANGNDSGEDCAVESPTQIQTDALARLQPLPKVCARAERSPTPGDGDVILVWWKGDIPVMSADGSDIVACASRGSSREAEVSGGAGSVRERAFTASEYARLMHVLCDARMTRARELVTLRVPIYT